MYKEFTIEEKQIIIENLKICLKSYFKDYQINLKTIELGYCQSKNKNGNYWIDYTIAVEINDEKENIKVASAYILTDGKNILDMEYPGIPKEIKRVNIRDGQERQV